ncbi:MAG TPA: spore coat protein [Bacillota bacterium]|mgnify:CR=1 FL=1|nr:spore coat protein [Bacillota bacterium]
MTIYRRSQSKGNRAEYIYFHDERKLEKRCSSCGSSSCDSCCDSDYNYQSDDSHYNSNNNFFHDATFSQEADQYSFMDQESAELIWVRESCNINVTSRDTQAAVSLQAALQVAIGLVLSISILDGDKREKVTQELLQYSNITQTNRQKIFICNTKDANVTTRDTDIAINVQLLLQILLTLVVLVDIL